MSNHTDLISLIRIKYSEITTVKNKQTNIEDSSSSFCRVVFSNTSIYKASVPTFLLPPMQSSPG